jgi:hypothetical protein
MKKMFLCALTAASAFCRIVSVGVMAGVPLGNTFVNTSETPVASRARRYLAGATAELHLPLRFSIDQLNRVFPFFHIRFVHFNNLPFLQHRNSPGFAVEGQPFGDPSSWGEAESSAR